MRNLKATLFATVLNHDSIFPRFFNYLFALTATNPMKQTRTNFSLWTPLCLCVKWNDLCHFSHKWRVSRWQFVPVLFETFIHLAIETNCTKKNANPALKLAQVSFYLGPRGLQQWDSISIILEVLILALTIAASWFFYDGLQRYTVDYSENNNKDFITIPPCSFFIDPAFLKSILEKRLIFIKKMWNKWCIRVEV